MSVRARAEIVWRLIGRRWLLLLLVLASLVAMTSHRLERHLLYYPSKEIEGDPSDRGLAYENLSILTEDGLRLHGWFVPCPGARRTLLILHGNAGNISHRIPWIEMLRGLEAHVLAIDYRGYGRSEGVPYEKGLYRDAGAAYAWWNERFRGTDQRLIVVGESLGGAVAVDLAARVPVAGLVLQSTFTSAWDMAKTMLPFGLLQPLMFIHFDSAAKIRHVASPKLFIHGNRDDIVPIRLGKRLFDAAPAPKEFYEVRGASHNDLLWVAGHDYTRRLSALPVGGRSAAMTQPPVRFPAQIGSGR
jgi:uncharacterized protein